MEGGMLVEYATNALKMQILTGELEPGAKLRVKELADQFGIGGTPIREALWRLTTSGLARAVGNRGFFVAELSELDLKDIVETRILIEVEALKRSMANGDAAWEAGIIASLHSLKSFVANGEENAREGHPDFDQLHKDFHVKLVSACGSNRLLELQQTYYDYTYRYRVAAGGIVTTATSFNREHVALANSTIARDVEEACSRLTKHLFTTYSKYIKSKESS